MKKIQDCGASQCHNYGMYYSEVLKWAAACCEPNPPIHRSVHGPAECLRSPRVA